jgi:hypothetical protein
MSVKVDRIEPFAGRVTMSELSEMADGAPTDILDDDSQGYSAY